MLLCRFVLLLLRAWGYRRSYGVCTGGVLLWIGGHGTDCCLGYVVIREDTQS